MVSLALSNYLFLVYCYVAVFRKLVVFGANRIYYVPPHFVCDCPKSETYWLSYIVVRPILFFHLLFCTLITPWSFSFLNGFKFDILILFTDYYGFRLLLKFVRWFVVVFVHIIFRPHHLLWSVISFISYHIFLLNIFITSQPWVHMFVQN